MTVKDLLELLQFYPINAEIFVETRDGKLKEFGEINETSLDKKTPALIMTVKEPRPHLEKVT